MGPTLVPAGRKSVCVYVSVCLCACVCVSGEPPWDFGPTFIYVYQFAFGVPATVHVSAFVHE